MRILKISELESQFLHIAEHIVSIDYNKELKELSIFMSNGRQDDYSIITEEQYEKILSWLCQFGSYHGTTLSIVIKEEEE